jgi:ABC-type transporter Mla subunit MlaD
MQSRRNEILTGVLVLATVAILTGVLILLGAPGLFRPLVTYSIYFDNAAGIRPGAPVLLAGRKIGQVERLYSPVTTDDAARAIAASESIRPQATPAPDADATPRPRFEARIDVRVDESAAVFRDARARMITLGLLGETAIDFTQGNETAGRAQDGETFVGERVPDFGEAISTMLEMIQPVAKEATGTLKELQHTAQNLSKLTEENSQLNMSLAQFRTFAENLTTMTATDSSLQMALKNVEQISADLAQLTDRGDIQVTLQNFRDSSERLKRSMNELGPDLTATGQNVRELTDTVKTQPWRLVWPNTVRNNNEEPRATAGDTITVRKTARARGATPTPSPTPPRRGFR